jgi:hypothetical protein
MRSRSLEPRPTARRPRDRRDPARALRAPGLLVPVFAALAVAAAPGWTQAPPVFDHLKCFQVADRQLGNTIVLADLFPRQGPPFADQTCRVKLRARRFCVDVAKTEVAGAPFPPLDIAAGDARDYFCYRLRCPKEFRGKGLPIEVEDQFGRRRIAVKDADVLCAPAERGTPGPTPTATLTASPRPSATPTPTVTPTPGPCGLVGGAMCMGDCPADRVCLFDGDACGCFPDSVRCQPREDGPSGARGAIPMCSGLCPGIAEVCVAGTGPDCVCIEPL